MKVHRVKPTLDLANRLLEAEALIEALLSGEIDAVVDSASKSPVLLAKAQDALRESEARYRRIVETAYEGLLTSDEAGLITFVNPRLTELLGHTARQMVGQPQLQFLPEGGVDEPVVRLRRKDGSELVAGVKRRPFPDAQGKVGALTIVTERKLTVR